MLYRSPFSAAWRAGCALLLAAGLALPAAAHAQDTGEPLPILLGEYVFVDLAADNSAAYTVTLPEDGVYQVIAVDDAAAESFDLTITGEAGDELAGDVFAELQAQELELAAGPITFHFTAAADDLLSFVVVGEFGSLSDDDGDPGQLINGGHVTVQDVAGTLYAVLTVEPSPYLQEVNLYVDSAGDAVDLEVSDDDNYYSLNTDSDNVLRFWTTGGDYNVILWPADEVAEVTLIPFLSGPLPALVPGEEVAGTLADDTAVANYRLDVPEDGAGVTISLISDAEDTDFELRGGTEPGGSSWSGTAYGPEESMSFVVPTAGTYYIQVYSAEGAGDYTITATLEGSAPPLTINGATWDTVAAGAVNSFSLHVDEPDQLLTVLLFGPEDVDLDLGLERYGEEGEAVHVQSSQNSGALEAITVIVDEAGLYTLTVNGEYAEEDTSYFIVTRLEEPARLAGQWAVEAEATSQYGEDGWSAAQATGPANAVGGTDDAKAWAPEAADSGLQSLVVTFERPVHPVAVDIYESHNPGAVIAIEAYDEPNDAWFVLWEGESSAAAEAAAETAAVFSPALKPIDFTTTVLRITLDTELVSGWNEIDAVQLFGRP